MIILGIDPGSRITGFGVLKINGNVIEHVSHGVILLNADDAFAIRMRDLSEGMREIVAKYKPGQVSVEKIFLGKNADSAFKLGHARGVVLSESARNGALVFEYATRVVKKGIVGNGAASKEQVQLALQRLLNIKAITRIDASDALALAAHHAFQMMNPLQKLKASAKDVDL